MFRRSLGIQRGWLREAAALAALATAPIGTVAGPVTQLAALVVVLAATIALEKRLHLA